MKSAVALSLALAMSLPTLANAQDRGSSRFREPMTTVYAGIGPSDTATDMDAGGRPWSIGFLSRNSRRSNYMLGAEIGREGTVLDSTYSTNRLKKALSLNFLLGSRYNIGNATRMSVDGALLLGFRESSKDCPPSFVGYRCYADEEPDTDWTFNYGGLVMLRIQDKIVGVRVAEESSQLILGIGF